MQVEAVAAAVMVVVVEDNAGAVTVTLTGGNSGSRLFRQFYSIIINILCDRVLCLLIACYVSNHLIQNTLSYQVKSLKSRVKNSSICAIFSFLLMHFRQYLKKKINYSVFGIHLFLFLVSLVS